MGILFFYAILEIMKINLKSNLVLTLLISSLSIVTVIILATYYSIYKINEFKNAEKESISTIIEPTINKDIATNQDVDNEKTINPVIKTIQKEIDSVVKREPNIGESNSESEEESSPVLKPETSIEIASIRQAAYSDTYGGTYGSYEIELAINTTEGDIFVAPSTSNTVGTGDIGFSYTVLGDSFRGIQDSKITCSLKQDDYCKIKDDGVVRKITITIFLYPDSESNGNYAINFEKFFYHQNGSKKEFDINQKTVPINIQY